MNWFKETWWLVKQLFTTTKNKDIEILQRQTTLLLDMNQDTMQILIQLKVQIPIIATLCLQS